MGSLLPNTSGSSYRVIEFGCSGGNNLKLMRELIEIPIDFVGFDIQHGAITFAKSEFPDDIFVLGGVDEFLRIGSTIGHFDVFLASAVLHYLPLSDCQSILEAAAKMSDLVVICDDLSRFECEEGVTDGLFRHPFRHLCHAVGLQVVAGPSLKNADTMYSIFAARPLR